MIIDHSCPTLAIRWGTATGEHKEKGQMSDQCPPGSEYEGEKEKVSRTTATGLDSSTARHPRLQGISSSCTFGIIRTFLDVLGFVEVFQTVGKYVLLPGPHCPGLSPIHFWDCREHRLIFSELAQVWVQDCSFRRNFLEIVNQPCESDWAPMCAVNSSACSEIAMNINEHLWTSSFPADNKISKRFLFFAFAEVNKSRRISL